MTAAIDLFVHRFEPATDPAAPALLLLHGTGADERDLLPLGRIVAPGAALLSPRGQVLEGSMPRFFRRLAEGVFDQEDLAFRTEDLARFVAAAANQYQIDPGRLFALGFSNGANIAASLLLRNPSALAGAVLIRAMLPFPAGGLPQDLAGKRVLLLNGSEDPIVPPHQPEQLAAILRAAGAEVQLDWQPAGHPLAPSDVERARDWLVSRYVLR